MTRRIDVEINDQIDNSVKTKIEGIAKAAREAQHALNLMQKAVAGINLSGLNGAASSVGKLSTAQEKLTRQQKESTKAVSEANRALPLYVASVNKVIGIQSNLTRSARDSAAAYNKFFNALSSRERASAFQQDINKILGVQKSVAGAARESAAAFTASFKQQELAAREFANAFQQDINRVLGIQDKATNSARASFRVYQELAPERIRVVQSVAKEEGELARIAQRAQASLSSSVENLTRKYNPLQAEINELSADQQRLNAAFREGAISADNYELQISEVSRRLEQVTAAQIKFNIAQTAGGAGAVSASRSIRQQRQALNNLSFQLQDIGVSLASGQNPFTVLIQQGSQIAQIYGVENGVRGVFRGLATDLAGFARLIRGPLIAVAAVTGAVGLLQSKVNETRKEQASFGAVAKATFTVFRDAVLSAVRPLTQQLAPALSGLFDLLQDFAVVAVEQLAKNLIRVVGTFSTVIANFPRILGASLQTLVVDISTAVLAIINAGVQDINRFLAIAESALDRINILSESRVSFGRVEGFGLDENAVLLAEASAKTFAEVDSTLNRIYERADSFSLEGSLSKALDAQAVGMTAEQLKSLNDALQSIFDNAKRSFQQNGLNEYERAIFDINIRAEDLAKQYGALNAEQLKLVAGAKAFATATVDFRKNADITNIVAEAQSSFDAAGLDDYGQAIAAVDKQIADLTVRYGALNEQDRKRLEIAKELTTEAIARDRIREILEETATPAEKLAKQLAEINSLRSSAKTAKELAAINRKVEELLDSVDGSAQIFKDFATDIGNRFTDVFQNIFDGGRLTFRSLADDIYSIFTRLLARMAVLALAKPVIVPLIQSVGSAVGAGQGSIRAVASQFGINDIGNVAGLSSLGNGLGNPLFSGGSGVANVIDSVGAKLGIGGGLAQGPTLSGAAGYQAGLASSFTVGSSLAGLGGNLLTNAIFGDRGIGATIGGTVGSVGGTIAGAQLGTILGLAGGPVGAALGAVGGNLIGGLFGNSKPSDKTQVGVVDIASGNFTNRRGLDGKKFSQENFDAVTQFAEIFSQIGGALGSKDSLSLIVGNRDGLRFQRNGGAVQTASDPAQFIKEITRQLNLGAPEVSQSLLTALDRIDFSEVKDNLEGVLADINFAIAFDDLDFVPEEVSQIVAEFRNLNTIFDEAQATARRLGLEEQRIIEKREEVINGFVSDFNNLNRNAIFSSVLPQFEQLLTLEDQRQQAIKDAAEIGADVALVELRYQRELEAILAQNFVLQSGALEQEQERLRVANDLSNRFSRVVNSFDQILFDLDVGRFTAKDPITRIDDFRTIIEDLSARSRLNDVDAQERLAQLLPEFLQLSEETFGASTQFARDLEFANKIALDTRSAAQRQLDIQIQIAASAQKQVELLQQISTLGGIGADQRFISGSFAGQSFSSSNPNEILFRAVQSGAIDSRTADALTRSAGFYGTPGDGRASAFFASNPTAADALFRALQAAGLSGFAAGGMISGGVAGRDSVPIMAMPGEYVIRTSSARNVGRPMLDYINQTGQLPTANDNTAVVAAIEKQTAVLARMGDKLIELETRVVNNTSGANREAAAWL